MSRLVKTESTTSTTFEINSHNKLRRHTYKRVDPPKSMEQTEHGSDIIKNINTISNKGNIMTARPVTLKITDDGNVTMYSCLGFH